MSEVSPAGGGAVGAGLSRRDKQSIGRRVELAASALERGGSVAEFVALLGEGNEFLWFRYLLYQTNPEVPWFYMPKDVHERLKLQLYNPEAFQAELEAWQKEVIEEQDAAGIKRGFGDAGAMSMGGGSGPAKLSIS